MYLYFVFKLLVLKGICFQRASLISELYLAAVAGQADEVRNRRRHERKNLDKKQVRRIHNFPLKAGASLATLKFEAASNLSMILKFGDQAVSGHLKT